MADFTADSRHEPDRPGYTCPKIDSVIDDLESIRSDNKALRVYGDYWKEKAEEYAEESNKAEDTENELRREICAMEENESALERRISELEAEIEELNNK